MIATIVNNPGLYMTYALTQAVVVLLLIRFLDLYGREPLPILVLMALWGATGAALLSLVGNEALDSVLSGDARDVFASAVSPPLVEEAAKGVALVAAVITSRWVATRVGVSRFEGLTHGIVYGAAVGLGFAFTEDFFYFLDRARIEGVDAGLDVFLGRRDFFGPSVLHHALFTAAFGAGLGLATWTRRRTAQLGFAVAGFVVAVLMHAVNNGLVDLTLTQRYGLSTAASWARDEPVPAGVSETADSVLIGLRLLDYAYIAAFLVAVALWLRYQRRVIRSELMEEAQSGLISREEWALMFRYWSRSLRYWQLLRTGRFLEWRLERRLHAALIELALLKWRLRRYGGDWSMVNGARRVIATLGTPDDALTNLPGTLSPQIGRARELDDVVEQLRGSDVRLLTLTGPGGVGKTLLALHVAARLRDSYASGVFFVPRIADPDPALLPTAIAQALGLAELDSGRATLEHLEDFFRDKQLLLIVDGFEQAIDAAPAISRLIASAPRLTVLTTSRQALRVSGEREYAVPLLPVPPSGATATLGLLREYGSVELFLHRAKQASSSFELTPENAPAVVGICRHLDGLPLAVNLAAARVRTLPPQALLERLRDPLSLLTGGERDQTVRHQTLRATIDWSYRLLDAEEQRFYARLAVFSGGFTLDAAHIVVEFSEASRSGVLDRVSSLVEKNLVRSPQGVTGDPRFSMVETIREHALERLVASGELATVRAAHAEYYLSLAETTEPKLMGTEQILWASRLDEEYENFRAVLAWALVPERVERLSGALHQSDLGGFATATDEASVRLGLRLVGALARIWEQRGHLSESRRWLEAALGGSVPLPDAVRGRALLRVGRLAQLQSDYERATAALEEALELVHGLGDGDGVARAHSELGWIALVRGDFALSEQLLTDALALAGEQGDRRLIASVATRLGRVLVERGDLESARDSIGSGLAIRKTLSDKRDMADSLTALGRLELINGRLQEAASVLQRALSLSRDLGAKPQLSDALYQRSLVAIELGEVAWSSELLQERLLLCRELGDRRGLFETLGAVAQVRSQSENTADAVRLLGAADALRESLGARQWPYERSLSERLLSSGHRLGPVALEEARADGSAMSVEAAVQQASATELAFIVPRQFSQPLVFAG